jgi:RNA recognition motif-containing protein
MTEEPPKEETTEETTGDAAAAADVVEEEKDGEAEADAGETAETGGESNTGGDDEEKGRRVYIGNLSWGVSWQDLKDHMREAGEVTRADIMTGPDGRSKGCGIVEYATAEEAKKAVLTLNDTELNGRQVFVREDRETSGSRSGGNRFSSDETAQSRRVYVGNLSWDVAWQDLKDHMVSTKID